VEGSRSVKIGVKITFACGCTYPIEKAKKRKNVLICPKHGEKRVSLLVPCEICGKKIVCKNISQKLCPECTDEKGRERRLERYHQQRQAGKTFVKPLRKAMPKGVPTLDEIRKANCKHYERCLQWYLDNQSFQFTCRYCRHYELAELDIMQYVKSKGSSMGDTDRIPTIKNGDIPRFPKKKTHEPALASL
jgi:hypothetical protein